MPMRSPPTNDRGIDKIKNSKKNNALSATLLTSVSKMRSEEKIYFKKLLSNR